MENIQILKHCPWISELFDLKAYFGEYNKILDEANGMQPHNEKFDFEESLRDFFHLPEDLDIPLSRRSTPAFSYHKRSNSIESNRQDEEPLAKHFKSSGGKKNNHIVPFRSKSADDIEDTSEKLDQEDIQNDPFFVKKMEEHCSVDLLTVDGELPLRNICESGVVSDSGRLTNWYAGAFMDGVIPDEGPSKLVTLACQAKELYKRETVKNYTRLRHRLLKYSSTVRMIMKKENSPEDFQFDEAGSKACRQDIILNVRIQRPFHKKSYQKKGSNRYPRHSQEFYMLGSQTLAELRDFITCINDVYVHVDMSDNPDPKRIHTFPSSEELFPSALIYINGEFYSDMRNPNAVDNSITLKNWAKRYPIFGEMKTFRMDEKKLSDLNLRLGYPYLYQHLGNCEHLITFTDARLLHPSDIQAVDKYPLSRGNPIKLSMSCYACNLHLANWILKDDPRIPTPYVHLCDQCLKLFFYDNEGKKTSNFKLYPFMDEFAAADIKEKKLLKSRNVEINIPGPDGKQSKVVIEPFKE